MLFTFVQLVSALDPVGHCESVFVWLMRFFLEGSCDTVLRCTSLHVSVSVLMCIHVFTVYIHSYTDDKVKNLCPQKND